MGFPLHFTFFGDVGDAGFFAKWRIGQHHIEGVARLVGQGVVHVDGAAVALMADAVQVEIHDAKAGGVVYNFPAVQGVLTQVQPLVTVELVVLADRFIRCQEEAAGAASRVANGVAGLGLHHIDHRLDERAGREVLARAGFDVLGVLFQQPFVDVGLDVHIEAVPVFAVDEADEALELGRVLNAVLRLAEDGGDEAAPLAQFGQNLAIVAFQLVAVQVDQAGPTISVINGGWIANFAPLVIHFEEEEVGKLLDVIAVGEAVIAQNGAVVPEALDNSG